MTEGDKDSLMLYHCKMFSYNHIYILEGKRERKCETEKGKPLVHTSISPQYIVNLSEPYGMDVVERVV